MYKTYIFLNIFQKLSSKIIDYLIKLKAINNVATDKTTSPDKKIISAIFSNRLLTVLSLLIEMKERIQLVMKITTARTANSSIKEPFARFNFFKEVKTIKHIPSKLADVLKICGDLFSDILVFFF